MTNPKTPTPSERDEAKPVRYGRSEYITLPSGHQILVWAVYSGREGDAFEGKNPVAWFSNHGDAADYTFDRRVMAERERCAQICDGLARREYPQSIGHAWLIEGAAAIRAGTEPGR
jgi:hypothetical protein